MTKIDAFDKIEFERYELRENPLYRFDISRRDFCRIMGGGLLVLLALPASVSAQESGGEGRGGRAGGGGQTDDLTAWIRIDPEGRITACTGKVEGGQGSRTSLAQVVADELRVPVEAVVMIMGDTQLTPFDRGTFGSQTTPIMAPQLRRAAAAAREALIDLAAQSWSIPRDKIKIADGKVSDSGTSRTASLADLTKGRALTHTIKADEPVTPPSQWTVAGKPTPNVNGKDIVTGAHKYPSDITRPGMMFGRVLRAPAVDAKLVSVDTTEAAKMPGVVVAHDNDFVGVAAPTPEQAARALAAITAKWSPSSLVGDTELFDYLKKNPSEEGGGNGRSGNNSGNVEQGLAAAAIKLEQTYTVPYIAHAPLEPRAAVAEWADGKLTVWTGTQRPFGVRSDLAHAFTIGEDAVRVIMPDMGSGYGGKHSGECAIEAARLAKAAGKPVKLVWTRPEEFTWAYFRPAAVIDVRSGMDAKGAVTTWEFHNWNSGGSGIRTPYEVPNQKVEFHATRSPLRQGSYRALASTANHFARESHMDELAAAAKIDPLQFRLANMKDDRLRAVLEAAAKAFGWDARKKSPNRGFGLACGTEKGGYIALCVEMSVPDDLKKARPVRAVTAFECGAIVNPDNLKNQVEGAVIQGLGGALFEAIRFKDGEIHTASFSEYKVPRFSDAPKLETILLDRKDLASAGAGECPIIAIAPAIANAIFDATGKRLRALPLLQTSALHVG